MIEKRSTSGSLCFPPPCYDNRPMEFYAARQRYLRSYPLVFARKDEDMAAAEMKSPPPSYERRRPKEFLLPDRDSSEATPWSLPRKKMKTWQAPRKSRNSSRPTWLEKAEKIKSYHDSKGSGSMGGCDVCCHDQENTILADAVAGGAVAAAAEFHRSFVFVSRSPRPRVVIG